MTASKSGVGKLRPAGRFVWPQSSFEKIHTLTLSHSCIELYRAEDEKMMKIGDELKQRPFFFFFRDHHNFKRKMVKLETN